MSSDGATVRGRDTAWQTAYGTARMAVEIAKESSDMFLPLKAVVGAVSILIKNYDVSLSYSRAENPLIFCLLPPLANFRQYGGREGDTAEGVVAIWCTCLPCERERLCRESEESGASEVRTRTNV